MPFLLVAIYIAFIGLGVPDSLIGSAWPAIHTELDIFVEAVSFITFIISGCTVLSSMFSAKILNKIGTSKVTAFSTAMTAAALFGFSFAESFWIMIPLAVILGLGAGAIDSGLNNYVALHFKASHMNFLHCFYGVGVSLSPYLMSVALSNTGCYGLADSICLHRRYACTPAVSLISGIFGIKIYPLLIAVLYAIMIVFLKLFINNLKKKNRYDRNV